MAIEGIAASVVGKELAAKAAVEAAKQLAQKLAGDVATKGMESQMLSPDCGIAQESFRLGELHQPTSAEFDNLKSAEEQVCNTLSEQIESSQEVKPSFDGEQANEVVDGDSAETTESNSEAVNEGADEDTDVRQDAQDAENQEGGEKTSYEIHTRNESLEGDRHPITGVPFEQKTVEDAEGNEVTGVFPVFESVMDAQLPEEMLQSSDRVQFDECNRQLKEAVDNDPELAEKFTPEQREQIQNGETPDGYTWHHNEEKGKMQLVDSDVHAQTGHTGGKTIWGGGSEFR